MCCLYFTVTVAVWLVLTIYATVVKCGHVILDMYMHYLATVENDTTVVNVVTKNEVMTKKCPR